ncbi:MAG: hypothetical protein WA830_04880, partial [Candidatus Sulfotelmatobacter sp.]
MGLAGLCLHRLCPNVVGFSLTFLLALTVLAPPSLSQSPGSPPAGPRNTTDQTSSEVDTAHVSIPTLREGRKGALRVDVNLVTVPVTVTDAMSHAVTGLRKE